MIDYDAIFRKAREGGALDDLIGSIPYARFMGLETDRHGDEVTLRMPFRDALIGNFLLPALHGGSIAALMEIAATVQIALEFESDGPPKPIDIAVDYFRSGRPQDTYARAQVMKPGRRVVNIRVEAWQHERSKPIAALHGHFLLRRSGTPATAPSA